MLHQKKKKRAFTLIELLVVIAIISILAAILFPVFARARENARRTSCLSNMKQIGLGIMQYTQDFDERYPPQSWCGAASCSDEDVPQTGTPSSRFRVLAGGTTGNHRTWMDFIYPYVKSTQLFACPSAGRSPNYSATMPSYGYALAFSSFGPVSWYMGVDTPYNVPLSLSTVTRPAEVIMIADHTTSESHRMSLRTERAYLAATSDWQYAVAPHLEGGNLIYADGHAKWNARQSMLAAIGSFTNPTGSDVNADRCNLNSPDYTKAYCSRAWNPYLN